MARIPQEEIDRLQREVSVQRLAEARGVKLRRSGHELLGLCPFHKDTDPSLRINPGKNLWHCLGACNEGGGAIEWVMRAEGISFRHAVELLREDHLPLAAGAGEPPKKGTVTKLPPPIDRNADDRALLLQVVGYYNETLRQSPEALRYLEKRGLQSSEMIEHFRLGFSNRTLAYRLPAKNRIAGADMRGRLQKLGLLRESGHEHFNGSLVIPIFDSTGHVTQMYGRKITPNLREGTPLHLYLPGPHQGVWNEAALIASKEIILCEALIDALTFWCAGFRHVTTSYGVNGFTDELRAAFQKYGTKRIYIAYDRDEPGERAAQEHAAQLMEMGIECFRVQFPKGMDANEYALKVQPAPKALSVMLNRAAWLGKGTQPTVAVIEPVRVQEPAAAHMEEPPQMEPPVEPEPQIEQQVNKTDGLPAAPIPEEKIEPAAKEENAIPLPTAPITTTESVLPLAAGNQAAPSPMPLPSTMSPTIDIPTEIKANGTVVITLGDRQYQVRGLQKNTSYELLRVNVAVAGMNLRGELSTHADTFDLNSARHRVTFAKQAAEELGIREDVLRQELGRVRLKLEELRDQQIEKTLEKPQEIELSAAEKTAALELLHDANLIERILEDFAHCGVVGEETNKQVGYLAACSRLLDTPLAVLVQSSSAAGKSSLMEAVLALMPDEQRVQYSAMTGQALFYLGEADLKNKILSVVEEEGAQRAAYALKLLQSEGALSIASTGKDPNSGRLVTHQYRVEGPVMIFLTTTAIDVDEELLNRCLVLTVNEDREQTQAIHRKQREAQTIEGLRRKAARAEIFKLHRNAQRLLKPVEVVNPYAPHLTFPDNMTRTRRDHMKFLTMIRAIALLYQYQRPHKTMSGYGGQQQVEYIEATWDDVELAIKLSHEVLGRSLDELQPQTRKLLLLADQMVRRACEEQKIERNEFRFSRRDVRQFTSWGDTQLKIHLHRLEELEYLIVHRGGRGQSFVYELIELPSGDQSQPFLPGLIEIEKLRTLRYDTKKSGVEGEMSGAGRPQVGPVSVEGRSEESPVDTRLSQENALNPENSAVPGVRENPVVKKPASGVK